jgi:hypothetical protein
MKGKKVSAISITVSLFGQFRANFLRTEERRKKRKLAGSRAAAPLRALF